MVGTQQRARYQGKLHQSKPLLYIKPVIPSKVCFIAPSLNTSKPGSRLPLAASLTGKVTCIRQRLMSRALFANTSNAVSLRMALLEPVVMLAIMISGCHFMQRARRLRLVQHKAYGGDGGAIVGSRFSQAASAAMGAVARWFEFPIRVRLAGSGKFNYAVD